MFQCLQLFSVGWIKKKVVNQGEITCRKQYIFTKLKRGSHEIVPSHVPINLSKIPQSSPISLHYLPTKVKQTWCRKAINGMGCCDLWMAREMLPASFRVGHRSLSLSLWCVIEPNSRCCLEELPITSQSLQNSIHGQIYIFF